MIRYFSAAMIVVCTVSTYVFSQDNSPLRFNVIPPAPEAASLGKFIDMPVSTYTGLPKIEVPLFDLKSYELSLPISISYHASGIKWEEIPSWIGSGWALNAGGTVGRTIRGRHDEEPFRGFISETTVSPYSAASFFLPDGSVNFNTINSPTPSNFAYVLPSGICNTTSPEGDAAYRNMLYAAKGGLDLEPDLFFFSLPDGQSGKFVFARNKQIKFIPDQYVALTYSEGFNTWTITGRNGTVYFFEKKEIINNVSSCKEVFSGPETFSLPDIVAPSAWKLTKIRSANKKDSILFEYEMESLSYQTRTSATSYDRVAGTAAVPGYSTCINNTIAQAWRLKTISTAAGYRVEFIAGSNGATVAGSPFLKEAKLYHKNTFIKKISFNISAGSGIPTLNSIQESYDDIASPVNKKPSYEFAYYTEITDAPNYSYTNGSLDHWGYYNAAPATPGPNTPALIYQNVYYTGANREPSLEACRWMTLKEIKYPTGGTTTYDYELHSYSNLPNFQDFIYSPGLELIESVEFAVTNPNPSLPTAYQTKPFTIAGNTNVVILYEVPGVPGGGIPANGLHGALTKQSDPSFSTINFVSGNAQNTSSPVYNFSPGSYTLQGEFTDGVYALGNQKFYIRIYKVISMQDRVENSTLKGGGLRVKKITSVGDNTLVKTFSYNKANTNISSGKLASFPMYAHISSIDDGVMSADFCVINTTGAFLERSNASSLPLTVNQGSHVGYDEVIEYHGDATENNGYSIYRFTNTPDAESYSYPYVPNSSVSYKNGLLLTKEDYRQDHKLVSQTLNEYTYIPTSAPIVQALKVALTTNNSCTLCPNRSFGGAFYAENSERVELTKVINKVYDMSTDGYLETETKFTYNNYDQVIKSEQSVSNGGSRKKFTEYAYHTVLKTTPQEEFSYYLDPVSDNFEFIGGVRKTFHPNLYKSTEIYLTEHTPSSQSFSNHTTYVNGLYKRRLVFNTFDTQGNVLTFKKENDPAPISLIWSYDKLFPTAQVINANYDQVAYTSFENGGNDGNWLFTASPSSEKKTGEKSHALNQSISITGLNTAARYVVSYWAKGNPTLSVTPESVADDPDPGINNWRYYERIISNVTSFTISGSATTYIDELRLYPVGARMTTYTYDVKTGMTSSTDENNNTTYYEYNQRQQLEFILDFERNLLKKNEYHYSREN